MDIRIKDTIVLSDDNEYVVVSKIDFQERVYYYLIDKKDAGNIKFCKGKESNTIVELVDKELIKTLLPLFVDETNKAMASEL